MKIVIQSDYEPEIPVKSITDKLADHGYITKMTSNEIYFLRKGSKDYSTYEDAIALTELFKGFGEGRIKVIRQNTNIMVSIKFKWFLQGFTMIGLTGILTLIFYIFSGLNFTWTKLLIAILIVFPLTLAGAFRAKKRVGAIIRESVKN